MQVVLFFLICIVSTTIGAISGIGGGVIIKPVFDMFSGLDASVISFLSGCTVLSMSTFSLFGSKNNSVKVETKRGTLLAVGAAAGGVVGKILFDLVKGEDVVMISIIQNYILGFLTVGVFFYMLFKDKIKGYDIHNPIFCIAIGSFLGMTGAFLGIGGGPINLIVLYYFFSMETKLAALTSIYIIFFSQVTSLVSVFAAGGPPAFDIPSLIVMIFGGIGGGVMGKTISRKLSNKATDKLFTVVLLVIIGICVMNIIRYTGLLSVVTA